MQQLDVIGLICTLAAMLSVLLIFNSQKKSRLNIHEKMGLERLQELIESVGGMEKAKFYTNGHPYVWVESTYEEIRELVLFSCVGARGMSKPASFVAKTNKESGHVYLVATNELTFEWSSLQHYEEWLKSNEPFAERITKYKEGQ